MPYFAPGAVGRHVLTLDNPVGFPQSVSASIPQGPLFYPHMDHCVFPPFFRVPYAAGRAVGYTVLGGSSTLGMPQP